MTRDTLGRKLNGKSEFTLHEMEQILEDIYDLEGITDSEVIFLCYEKSDDFCHRHILREYLNENFNTNITELGVD